MRNWKANVWLTALALLPLCIVGGEPQLASAAPAASTEAAAAAAPGAVSSAMPAKQSGLADELPPAAGSLTLQWTLGGRSEPLDCGGLGIDRFQVSLTSAAGAEVDPWQAPCDAFQISIDLPPGAYTGEAVMVDRLDRPVTLNVPIDQVEVVAGRDVVRAVDFPMAAFLWKQLLGELVL